MERQQQICPHTGCSTHPIGRRQCWGCWGACLTLPCWDLLQLPNLWTDSNNFERKNLDETPCISNHSLYCESSSQIIEIRLRKRSWGGAEAVGLLTFQEQRWGLYSFIVPGISIYKSSHVLCSSAMDKTGSNGEFSDLCAFFFYAFFFSPSRPPSSETWTLWMLVRRGWGCEGKGEPAPGTFSSHCSVAAEGCWKEITSFSAMGTLVLHHAWAAHASLEHNTLLVQNLGLPVLFSLNQECPTLRPGNWGGWSRIKDFY